MLAELRKAAGWERVSACRGCCHRIERGRTRTAKTQSDQFDASGGGVHCHGRLDCSGITAKLWVLFTICE